MGIREISATDRTLIPLQTRLRFTTMIVLPDGEDVLDVICGDKDFWIISATRNIVHVKPAKEGATTNFSSESGDQRGDRVLVPAQRKGGRRDA
jgi:hypothetical protein